MALFGRKREADRAMASSRPQMARAVDPDRAPRPGLLGPAKQVRTSLDLDAARQLTAEIGAAGRDREFPTLPWVVEAGWEFVGSSDTSWTPPAAIDTFAVSEGGEERHVFVAYWPHSEGTDLGVSSLWGLSAYWDHTQFLSEWRRLDETMVDRGRTPGDMIQIAAPRVPAGLWETFLAETQMEQTPDNLAKASEMVLVGLAMWLGQAVEALEKGGRAETGAYERFRAACKATGDVESSMQTICDAFFKHGTHYVYQSQSAPQRKVAQSIEIWNRRYQ